MHGLRDTLGKEDEPEQHSVSKQSISSIKNKSKSIWALDPDEEDDLPKPETKVKSSVESTLMNAFKKDSTFSQMTFYEVVQQVQIYLPSQIQALTAIQGEIHSLSSKSSQPLKIYLSAFLECLIRRMKKIRRKQKKQELQEFDKIVQTNFKRKGAAFIDEDHPDKKAQMKKKQQILTKSSNKDRDGSSRKNGSSGSTDGKLSKLLSNSKLKEEKKQIVTSDNHQNQEESVSFSAAISQNMTVRQRKRQPVKKEKPKQSTQKKEEGVTEGQDQAFIFYRPKNNKKK